MRYLVFGRVEYAESLTHQGFLEASAERASEAAIERFGSDWVELTLVPEASVGWILRAEKEAGSDDDDD